MAPPSASAGARRPKKASAADAATPPSQLIDRRIAELQDWRGPMLSALRDVIRQSSPGIVEEWKWNTPVWSCEGIVCTGEVYKKAVKLTFAHGAALPDPEGLFNSSLDGRVRRAIDVPEGARVNTQALAALVREAIAHNKAGRGVRPAGPA